MINRINHLFIKVRYNEIAKNSFLLKQYHIFETNQLLTSRRLVFLIMQLCESYELSIQ